MRQDISHAFRTLRHAPCFTTAALLTLSLGIGATTVVFSFVNGLVRRPLPFGKATSRIVSLHGTHASQFPDHWDDAQISYADLQDIRRLVLGLLAGMPVAVGVAQVLERALYGVTSSSATFLYAGPALVLVVPILLAGYLPARRAARITPMAALRDE